MLFFVNFLNDYNGRICIVYCIAVLFGIFAGALSVVLSMIIFLCPISKESVHVVISSKVGVLEIDNTQYHIKDVFRASEDSTIVKYVCADEFPAQDLKFTKIN